MAVSEPIESDNLIERAKDSGEEERYSMRENAFALLTALPRVLQAEVTVTAADKGEEHDHGDAEWDADESH